MELLLQLGSPPDSLCSEGRSPLHYAAQGGGPGGPSAAVKVLQALLLALEARGGPQQEEGGADVEGAGAQGGRSCGKVQEEVQRADCHGWLPLHYAAKQGAVHAVQLLMKVGCGAGGPSEEGRMVCRVNDAYWRKDQAAWWQCQHCYCLRLEWESHAGDTDVHPDPLPFAPLPPTSLHPTQAGSNCNTQAGDGSTALHLATRASSAPTMQVLLQAGADPGLTDSSGCSAAHYAAQQANRQLFEMLFSDDGAPAVMHACDSQGAWRESGRCGW